MELKNDNKTELSFKEKEVNIEHKSEINNLFDQSKMIELYASFNFANNNSKSSNYYKILDLESTKNNNQDAIINKLRSQQIVLNDNYKKFNNLKIVYFSKLNEEKLSVEDIDLMISNLEKILTEINDFYHYDDLNEIFFKNFSINLRNILFLDLYCDFLYIFLLIKIRFTTNILNLRFVQRYLVLFNLRIYSMYIVNFTENLYVSFFVKVLDMFLLILKFLYNFLSKEQLNDLLKIFPKKSLYTIINEIQCCLDKFMYLIQIDSIQMVFNIYVYISLIYYFIGYNEKSKFVFVQLIEFYEDRVLNQLKSLNSTNYKNMTHTYINCLMNYFTLSVKIKNIEMSIKVITKLFGIIENCQNLDKDLVLSIYYKYGKTLFNMKIYDSSSKTIAKMVDLLESYSNSKYLFLKAKSNYLLAKIYFIQKLFKESLKHLNIFIEIYQNHYDRESNERLYNAYKLYLRIWTINNTYDINLVYIPFLLSSKHFFFRTE